MIHSSYIVCTEPLCPHCMLATEPDLERDGWRCPSPVCRGFVAAERMVRTPRWRWSFRFGVLR